jgi:chloramphenicol 3-O-phosphotransferase
MTRPPKITQRGYRVINGVYAAIAAFCRSGNSAIADDVVYDAKALKLARDNFSGLNVFSVGLICELAEAERREISRGNRAPGGAAVFHGLVHLHMRYDFALDVTHISAAEAAHQIVSAYYDHPNGTSFWAGPLSGGPGQVPQTRSGHP